MMTSKSTSVSVRHFSAMKLKKWIVRTFRWVAVGIAALILLLCAMFGLAQTDLGKRWLVTKLAQQLNAEGEVQVELGELEGLIPFNIELKHVRVSDDDGPLLKLENAHLHWSPWPLIRRRIHIEEISADVFRLDRLPRSEQKAEAKRKKGPAWPPRIPSFRLERLHVARLELGAGVIGQEGAFIIDGSFVMNVGEVQVSVWPVSMRQRYEAMGVTFL